VTLNERSIAGHAFDTVLSRVGEAKQIPSGSSVLSELVLWFIPIPVVDKAIGTLAIDFFQADATTTGTTLQPTVAKDQLAHILPVVIGQPTRTASIPRGLSPTRSAR
jgi:hypothetical protein